MHDVAAPVKHANFQFQVIWVASQMYMFFKLLDISSPNQRLDFLKIFKIPIFGSYFCPLFPQNGFIRGTALNRKLSFLSFWVISRYMEPFTKLMPSRDKIAKSQACLDMICPKYNIFYFFYSIFSWMSFYMQNWSKMLNISGYLII